MFNVSKKFYSLFPHLLLLNFHKSIYTVLVPVYERKDSICDTPIRIMKLTFNNFWTLLVTAEHCSMVTYRIKIALTFQIIPYNNFYILINANHVPSEICLLENLLKLRKRVDFLCVLYTYIIYYIKYTFLYQTHWRRIVYREPII